MANCWKPVPPPYFDASAELTKHFCMLAEQMKINADILIDELREEREKVEELLKEKMTQGETEREIIDSCKAAFEKISQVLEKVVAYQLETEPTDARQEVLDIAEKELERWNKK